ncbi:MAG: AcrR family transcriptional regulator [Planctomycetota bacterium]|jgi:AcrR family transcriptional regulator
MNPGLSRKQREIAEREDLLLDTAQSLLLEVGYLGLTMDRVAAATEYSKGTVYQHFRNKEDLIAGLLERYGQLRNQFFSRASSFQGCSRDRICAIGAAAELYMTLHPEHEQLDKILKSSSIREKASQERREALSNSEMYCFGIATGIAREAVAAGDLKLVEGDTVEQAVLGLWSLYTGAFLIRDLGIFDHAPPEMRDPIAPLLRNTQRFLDGLGWHPFSPERDDMAARARAMAEVFPAEAKAAGLL